MLARFHCFLFLSTVGLTAASARAQQPADPALLAPPGSIFAVPTRLPDPTLSVPETIWPTYQPLPPNVAPLVGSGAVVGPQASASSALPVLQEVAPASDVDEQTTDWLSADEDIWQDEAGWYEPTRWLSPAPWDTGVELGINGSSGTSDSISIRAGGYIKRESKFSKLDLSAYYNRTDTGGIATQDNAQFDVRNDWLLDESSPWTLFATGNVFYDEFQMFDLQINGNTGVGYRLLDDDWVNFILRLGIGTSREFGGPDDEWVPESLCGFDYDQRLTESQKFYGKLDYFPAWHEVGEYRLVADVGWEIELDQPSNLSLKVSASDRFDSTSNGAEPHLVNYSVLLLLKL